VIGVGYVGLVTAACFARAGYDVVCLDVDEAKLERLRAGLTPIHEPGMEEMLAESRERLVFTSSVAELFAGADIAFVCVDTPPSASGDADLSRVESVLEAIPAGTPRGIELADSALAAARGADAVVIVTEWTEFAAPFADGSLLAVMRTPLVIDGRNQLDPVAVRAAGFAYEGVGRGE